MRKFVLYLAVVSLLVSAWAVELPAGRITELNVIYVETVKGSWVGIYGDVGLQTEKENALFYAYPFLQFSFIVSPAVGEVSATSAVVELNTMKALLAPEGNWYIAVSPSSSVDFSSLEGTCEENLDALITGDFSPDCLPSKTYTLEGNIVVMGKSYCAKYALVGENNVPTYVLDFNGVPVYLSPISYYQAYDANFLVLLAADANKDFYIYLVRENPVCGDLVCDPGEEAYCSDCYEMRVYGLRNITLGQSLDINVWVRYVGSGSRPIALIVETNVPYTQNPGWYNFSYNDEKNFSVVFTPQTTGTKYATLRLTDFLQTVKYLEQNISFVVSAPPTEENQPSEETGGAAPPPEENVQPPEELPEGAIYIPELGCYSYVHIFGSDVVRAAPEENVTVPLMITAAGTCDETVHIYVHGIPEEWYTVEWNGRTIPAGESVPLRLYIRPTQQGEFTVRITAKGYSTDQFSFVLVVSGEYAGTVQAACSHAVLIMAPSEMVVAEGEELNNIIVRNMGTCVEDVSLRLVRVLEGQEYDVDTKSLKLNKGERYVYIFPKLVAGEYRLYAKAGSQEKVVDITVMPKGVTSVLAESLASYRWLVLVVLILLVISALTYVRYRYLR